MNETEHDAGLAAFQAGDFVEAHRIWLELAETGNPRACHNLAILYENGHGVAQDAQAAQQWCRKAAEAGDAAAQYHLGYLLMHAGTEPRPEAAVEWWTKAAENGLADAQFDLAGLYLEGTGVAEDTDTAADWYEAAALQGHPPAQFNLGVLYANSGHHGQARHWWTQAATAGDANAKAALEQLPPA